MRPHAPWIIVVLATGLVLPALAAGPTPQTVQKSAPNNAAGLFPHTQQAPPYAVSGANNEQAGMTHGSEPNAGATGFNGSGGAGNGTSGGVTR
ncbi:MAG TPA: hypothetical protein VIZ17_16085 [Acetobacteraceae bacterium]